MSGSSHLKKIELRLRAAVKEAEKKLSDATPEEKPEARRRLKEALRAFTLFVFEGKQPAE